MSNLTPRIDRIDKNYIINGAQEYYQVALSAAIPASYDYVGPDMFEHQYSGSWTSPNVERSTTKVGTRSRRSMFLTGTAGALSDELHAKTKIESILAMELVDGPFSLGFKLKSDNFTQVTIRVSYADAEDNFTSVTQIDEQTFTFLADSSEQEVKFENISPNPNMANGLQVEFEFKGLGSTGAVNTYVGEFILNKGEAKNDYTPCGRDQIEELGLCRRYFEIGHAHFSNIDFTPSSTTGRLITVSGGDFKSMKRAIPSMTFWGIAGVATSDPTLLSLNNQNQIKLYNTGTFHTVVSVSNPYIYKIAEYIDVGSTNGSSEVYYEAAWSADARL